MPKWWLRTGVNGTRRSARTVHSAIIRPNGQLFELSTFPQPLLRQWRPDQGRPSTGADQPWRLVLTFRVDQLQGAGHVMLYLWHDLHITECQLDELWSFVHTKEQNLASAVHAAATYGDAWIWIALLQYPAVLPYVPLSR